MLAVGGQLSPTVAQVDSVTAPRLLEGMGY